MPQWMQELITGWPLITANVPTFVVIVALICGALWVAFNWAYGRVIARKDSQIELQDRQLADYRQKLEGATPDEAKAKIEELEDRIRDTVAGPVPTIAATSTWKPVHLAIQHISEKIGDRNAEDCFEGSRLALRQAAYDQRVRLRGKKQMSEPSPFSGRCDHSDIYTDVDSGYWTNTNINALATSPTMQSSYHVDPQTAYAWGKLGINERNRYYDLQVNWDDILREWP
jgi:hypothetical protein